MSPNSMPDFTVIIPAFATLTLPPEEQVMGKKELSTNTKKLLIFYRIERGGYTVIFISDGLQGVQLFNSSFSTLHFLPFLNMQF